MGLWPSAVGRPAPGRTARSSGRAHAGALPNHGDAFRRATTPLRLDWRADQAAALVRVVGLAPGLTESAEFTTNRRDRPDEQLVRALVPNITTARSTDEELPQAA